MEHALRGEVEAPSEFASLRSGELLALHASFDCAEPLLLFFVVEPEFDGFAAYAYLQPENLQRVGYLAFFIFDEIVPHEEAAEAF